MGLLEAIILSVIAAWTPLLIAAEKRGHAIHFGIHMLNSQLELMMQFLGLDQK